MDELRRDPLHRQLARMLREEILEGRLRRGEALPSEAELCRRYGISRSTARQAISALSAEGLVRTEAGLGSFVASAGPGVQHPAGPTVGVVLPRLGGVLMGTILKGIQEALAGVGHALTVETTGSLPGGEERAIWGLRRRGALGVLVIPAAACATPPRFYSGLVAEGFPVVFVDRHGSQAGIPWVASDNVMGGRELARHLLGLGHRRIDYLLPRDFPTTSVEDRVHGARSAVAEVGLPPSALGLVRVVGDPNPRPDNSARVALEAALAVPAVDRPTAFMCANDELATEALAALREMDIAVPGDIALGGYDDLPYVRFIDPPLTTVRQDAREMGRMSVQMLLRILEKPREPRSPVLLPVELCIRQSTVGENTEAPLGKSRPRSAG